MSYAKINLISLKMPDNYRSQDKQCAIYVNKFKMKLYWINISWILKKRVKQWMSLLTYAFIYIFSVYKKGPRLLRKWILLPQRSCYARLKYVHCTIRSDLGTLAKIDRHQNLISITFSDVISYWSYVHYFIRQHKICERILWAYELNILWYIGSILGYQSFFCSNTSINIVIDGLIKMQIQIIFPRLMCVVPLLSVIYNAVLCSKFYPRSFYLATIPLVIPRNNNRLISKNVQSSWCK